MKRWLSATPLVSLFAVQCTDPTPASSSSSAAVTAIASSSAAAAAVASAPGKIGIAACDTYIARQRALLSGAPESERSGRVTALDAIESTWLQQSKTVDDPTRLTRACEASLAALDGDTKPPAPSVSPSPSASSAPAASAAP